MADAWLGNNKARHPDVADRRNVRLFILFVIRLTSVCLRDTVLPLKGKIFPLRIKTGSLLCLSTSRAVFSEADSFLRQVIVKLFHGLFHAMV